MSATAPHDDHPGHEHTDVDGRAILLGGLGVLAGIGLVAAAAGLVTRMESPAHRGPIQSEIVPPAQLRSDLRSELDRYRAAKESSLNGYAWIDRERGVARVPIERAMQMMVEQQAQAGSPK